MILVDMGSILYATAYTAWKNHVKGEEDLHHSFKSRVIEKLFKIKSYYHKGTEEMVLCFDSKNIWRKDFFPNYKANRKLRRAKDDIDWNIMFSLMAELREDLIENFFFKIVIVDRTEADDIVAVISRYLSGKRKITLISADKDFKQLHDIPQFKQFSMTYSEYGVKFTKIECDGTPKEELIYLVLYGDTSDGVPNIFSPDDAKVDKTKAVTMPKNTFKKLLLKKPINVKIKVTDEDVLIETVSTLKEVKDKWSGHYKRNNRMVNLDMIPKEYKQRIIKEYIGYKYKGSLIKLKQYFEENGIEIERIGIPSASAFVIGGKSKDTSSIDPYFVKKYL